MKKLFGCDMKNNFTALGRGMKLAAAVVSLLLPLNIFAYNLVVTLKVAETGEKIPEVRVFASNEDASSIYAYADYNASDSTYILKELPEKELSVFFRLGEKYLSDKVAAPRDSAVIEVPLAFMPRREELKELVVSEQSSKFEDNRQVYLPSKRDKRISQDGSDLLRNMAIPTISVTDDAIKTSMGEAVSVFIDYLPASASDIANIRTGDVRNVEVYDFPQDIRFGGARHVVNFIMAKYEYGGYTKLTGRQRFVYDQGYYSVFSKFAYKKMTYDIAADYYYDHSRNNGESTDAVYDFGDEKLDYSSRTLRMHEHENAPSMAFRALYQNDKTVISNIVGWNGGKQRNTSSSTETFSSPSYNSGDNDVSSNSDQVSAAWNGNYRFVLPKSFSLIIRPSASYRHNKNNYRYSGLSDIVNDTKENAWDTEFRASLNKKIGKHSIGVFGYLNYSGNDIDYLGTNPAKTDMKSFRTGSFIQASLSFGDLYISPSANIKTENIKVNGVNTTSVLPGYNIDASYTIDRKRQLSLGTCIFYSTPVWYMSDNYQMTDQINAITGNPNLKNQLHNNNYLQYTSFLNNVFSYTANIIYSHTSRNIAPVYIPTELDGHKVMLRKVENSGFTNLWQPGLTVTARLFKNALTLRGSVKGNIINQHGSVQCRKSKIEYNLQVTYSFHDFYVSGDFNGKSLICSPWMINEMPAYYNLNLGWSNGDLNVSMRMYNLFSSSYKSNRGWCDTSHYSRTSQYYHQSYYRNFMLRVTYTFSYGKKVNREEINAPQGVQSGILQ